MIKKAKQISVSRTFLLDLANKIYNPKTKRFLRLCRGTLQNGPDPTNSKRSMHCGLGELYFAMTGQEPKVKKGLLTEDKVVELALKHSTLVTQMEDQLKIAKSTIKQLELPSNIKDDMLQALDDSYYVQFLDKPNGKYERLKLLFENIPETNDDWSHEDTWRPDVDQDIVFKNRSEAIAKLLREAAMLLPA